MGYLLTAGGGEAGSCRWALLAALLADDGDGVGGGALQTG